MRGNVPREEDTSTQEASTQALRRKGHWDDQWGWYSVSQQSGRRHSGRGRQARSPQGFVACGKELGFCCVIGSYWKKTQSNLPLKGNTQAVAWRGVYQRARVESRGPVGTSQGILVA